MSAARRGKLITLEGLEGSGKSSSAAFVADQLRAAGHRPLLSREPGGTVLGEALRALLLEREALAIGAMSELLLLFAARAQHVETVIEPALAAGRWVLCDRFTEASYAYQGAGRGLGEAPVAALESLVLGVLRSDLCLLLDIDPAAGFARIDGRRPRDRIERESQVFFERVRAGYLARARSEPERIALIDASGSPATVQRALRAALAPLLQGAG